MDTNHFARRAEAIREELLAIDVERRPRVCLLIVAEDGTGHISGHRWPVDIDLPGDEILPPSFVKVAAAAQQEQFRRRLSEAVLRSAAELVARTVENLPAAAGKGVGIVDARLVVTYRDAGRNAAPAGAAS